MAAASEDVEAQQSSVDYELLLAENMRLRQRVDDLELTVVEYRRQMSQVLGSVSWRVTSPFRATTSRARTAKVRARRALKRLRARRDPRVGQKVLTAGLFAPPLDALPVHSPLRRPFDVNEPRRPAGRPRFRPEEAPTVAVVVHVHYPELWGDIEGRLARMPEPYDLIVTVTEGHAEALIPTMRRRCPDAHIEVVPNKGRDWAPLVRLVNKGLLARYEAVAKVHTKKSEHRIDGDGWRVALLDGVFESPEQVRRTIDLLREDANAGLVVPNGHVEGIECWGSNQGIVEMLAYRLPMAFNPDELRFPGGSMFWCKPWLLERLADLCIGDEHFEPEAGQYDGTTAHALERLVGVFSAVAGLDIVEAMDVSGRLKDARKNPALAPKVYAFYLPQYHRCPENDEFWGEGFTDWVNVKKARPLFEGHRQPLLPPAEAGFYDLADPEVLRHQAAQAEAAGIDGFVFHYYWFDGRKVLDTPIRNWLADPSIDLPLAISWANESWTRRWDGLADDILIEQTYGENWANRFWDDIAPYLRDPRYIRVNGAPMLVVYRMGQIPDAVEAIGTWRKRAADDGHPALHVLAVMQSRDFEPLGADLIAAVDGLVAFPPGSQVNLVSLLDHLPQRPRALTGDVFSYDAAFDGVFESSAGGVPIHPTVMTGWDNTARRGEHAYVFHGANPVTYARHFRTAVDNARSGMVFINAWNEWAEGAVLEKEPGGHHVN